MCLENLRTVVEIEHTICFHLADIYRGKPSQHWLQLIAIIFCRQAEIHVLDQQTYTPEKPITVLEALSIVHDGLAPTWAIDPCVLRYGKTAKRSSITLRLDQLTIVVISRANGWLITQQKTRPNWITYAKTDLLQAGKVVLCCPADLVSYSATARYVIRDYGPENIFRLRPAVGTAVRLAKSPTAPWSNEIFQGELPINTRFYTKSCTRASAICSTSFTQNELRESTYRYMIPSGQ